MNKKLFWNTLFIIGSTLSLMIPAFINGYPLVYSDTSTYIVSGFSLQPPFDRPITYGLFLRLFSLNGLSLWTVIGVQSLLLSWLIRLLMKRFVPGRRSDVTGFLAVLFLSLFTTISWTSSQLMPDIFTPIMLLSAMLLLTGSNGRPGRISLYFIFFISCAMHISHIMLMVVFLSLILIIRYIRVLKLKQVIGLRSLLILLTLALVSVFSMGSAISKSKHVFLMGALVEHGIAGKYLDEYCAEDRFKICAYKDSLPELAWQFIWDESSPFYKVGGWKETKEEFSEIIRGTVSSPEFLLMHVAASVKATFVQLAKFRIGDGNGIFLSGTQLHERMAAFFPHELESYELSMQNQGKLDFTRWVNILMQTIVVLSFIALLLFILQARHLPAGNTYFLFCALALLAVLMNAWTCGTFAGAIDRLGGKIIWFIPLCSVIGFFTIMKIHPVSKDV